MAWKRGSSLPASRRELNGGASSGAAHRRCLLARSRVLEPRFYPASGCSSSRALAGSRATARTAATPASSTSPPPAMAPSSASSSHVGLLRLQRDGSPPPPPYTSNVELEFELTVVVSGALCSAVVPGRRGARVWSRSIHGHPISFSCVPSAPLMNLASYCCKCGLLS